MKAFKQINLVREKRMVISYASALSLLGCLIIFSPVFGQAKQSEPLVSRTQIDGQQMEINFDSPVSANCNLNDSSMDIINPQQDQIQNLGIDTQGGFAEINNDTLLELLKKDPEILQQYFNMLAQFKRFEIERRKFMEIYNNRN